MGVGVAVGLGVGVAVGSGVGVAVGLGVGVAVGLGVGVAVGLDVGVAVGLDVGVAVGLDVGVAVGVGVGVAVGLDVGVAVAITVAGTVGVAFGDAVGGLATDGVGAGVGVDVPEVGWAQAIPSANARMRIVRTLTMELSPASVSMPFPWELLVPLRGMHAARPWNTQIQHGLITIGVHVANDLMNFGVQSTVQDRLTNFPITILKRLLYIGVEQSVHSGGPGCGRPTELCSY